MIIGGGVIGASLAYWLSRNSAAKVTVVEANATPAYQGTASFASAGLISSNPTRETPVANINLIKRSVQLYPELAAWLQEEQPDPIGYLELNELKLATSETAVTELQDRQQWYVSSGFMPKARWLSAQEVREIEPLATPAIFGAIEYPAALARPPWLTRALLNAAQKRGVTLVTANPVIGLIVENERLKGVKLKNGEKLGAERVVLAAGAWSGGWLDEQLQALGVTSTTRFAELVYPVRGQMLSVKPAADLPGLRHIIVGDEGYAFPRNDGSVAFGATSEPEAGFEVNTTPAGLKELGELVHSLIPALDRAAVVETWAGLRPGSKLGQPLLGPLPQLPDLWLCTGHYRGGIMMAPATAEVLGQALLGTNAEATARLKEYQLLS